MDCIPLGPRKKKERIVKEKYAPTLSLTLTPNQSPTFSKQDAHIHIYQKAIQNSIQIELPWYKNIFKS